MESGLGKGLLSSPAVRLFLLTRTLRAIHVFHGLYNSMACKPSKPEETKIEHCFLTYCPRVLMVGIFQNQQTNRTRLLSVDERLELGNRSNGKEISDVTFRTEKEEYLPLEVVHNFQTDFPENYCSI